MFVVGLHGPWVINEPCQGLSTSVSQSNGQVSVQKWELIPTLTDSFNMRANLTALFCVCADLE